MKKIFLHLNDVRFATLNYTSFNIEVDSYLYGGEEKKIYDIYIYLDNNVIFSSKSNKEISIIGKSLYIDTF